MKNKSVSAAPIPRCVKAAVSTVALIFLSIGCASSISTRYLPKDPDMVRLTVQGGQTGLGKNQAFAGLGPSTLKRRGLEMAYLMGCDKTAEETARRAKGDFQKAAALMNVGTIMIAIGVAPGLVTLPIVAPISAQKNHDAVSGAVDAMNMHNDIEACINPPPLPEPAAGAAAGYTNMSDLKIARAAGKISDDEFGKWQTLIRFRRQQEFDKLEQVYDDDKISRSEYKARRVEIIKKYEGTR